MSAIAIAQATDAICPVPLERWDWDALVAATAAGTLPPARFGGWVEGAELFDAAAFGVSVVEAELMDAQQRLLLEVAAEALGGAGGPGAAAISGANAAVAVGIASAEYNNWLLRRHGAVPSAYSATGGALSVASGRLAFTFNMRGPAISVDTACSSSLVAAHFAVTNMRDSTSGAALVAGVGLVSVKLVS